MSLRTEDFKNNTFVIVKNSNTGEIQQVVHLHDTKIGTTSISKDLSVTGDTAIGGDLEVEGTFVAGSFVGSIQTTADDLSYLVAGSGMKVTSGSNGQVELSTSKDEIYSLARIGANVGGGVGVGSFTVGVQFYTTKNITCTGVRFYWANANKTVKTQLWSNAGSSLASTTTSVTSTGVYESVFSSPQTLSAGTLYKVSAWQTDGTNYTASTGFGSTFPSRPFYGGGHLTYVVINFYVAGDAVPTSSAASEIYLLEPILQ